MTLPHGRAPERPTAPGTALVLTVGTGDSRDLDATLFEPLRKSVAAGAWSSVTLLPSQVSAPLAERFAEEQRRFRPDVPITVRPLPTGAEENADRSYDHFDSVLRDLLATLKPSQITIDFTRGTKAMSAAIVLAAARHQIHHLRYIQGDRDDRGLVQPGTERVFTIHADRVDRDQRLDLARRIVERGAFEAADEVLDGLTREVASIRQACRYYSAWDRLDYESAAAEFPEGRIDPAPEGWEHLWPTRRMLRWTGALHRADEEPVSGSTLPCPRLLRRLVADLIANGERRIDRGQFEDALVRAYRVLELIGQARLAEWGIDTADLDLGHPAVRRLQKKLVKGKNNPLQEHRGKLTAGRFQAARLLKCLEREECGERASAAEPRPPSASCEPERLLATALLAYENNASKRWQKLLKPHNRNQSLLIHGFRARAGSDPQILRDAFRRLARVARQGWGGEFDKDLKTAALLSFSRSARRLAAR